MVDFGARRAHGTDAACKVARTSYLAGAAGTSNLLAARQYGIPTFGTMAHSFVQAFDSEVAAFEAFARLYPATMLLVDTYDTLRGVDHVIELAKRLGNRFDVRAVRLDSGDLDELSKATRARLDTAGLEQVEIFASSGLDENRIAALLAARCPIDGFGVGTQLVVAQDAPALDMAYKLVAYDGSGRTKFSSGKVIYPGRKQVFRKLEHGVFCGDTLGEHGENLPGDPLLVPIMTNGRRIRQHAPTLTARGTGPASRSTRSRRSCARSRTPATRIRWRSATGSWANSPGCGTPTRPKPTPGPTSSGRRPNDPRTTSSSSLDFGLPTHRKLAVTPSSGGTP